MPAPPLTLALDAATYRGSVAVLAGSSVLAEAETAMRGATEERLMPAVAAALAAAGARPSDLSRVVCGAGPGSFTSLRIAGSLAKGLAVALRCPLHAVPSLLLVAAGAVPHLAPGGYLALLDAMRGERFAAEIVVGDDGVPALVGETRLVGTDAVAALARSRSLTRIGPDEAQALWPHARGVARLHDARMMTPPVPIDAWEPDYGRRAEAQVKWEAEHGRALPSA